MLSLSNMCKMRNKHLKQLKGKEGSVKKCLLKRRKLNLNRVLLVLQKNKKQNLLLYTAQESQWKTQEGKGEKVPSPAQEHHQQREQGCGQPGLTWASSVTVSLPTATPGGTALLLGCPITLTSSSPLRCTPKAKLTDQVSNTGSTGEQHCLALVGDAEQQQDPLLPPGAAAAW